MEMREDALRIFADEPSVLDYQNLEMITQMLIQSIAQNHIDVRIQAVRALGALILAHEDYVNVLEAFTNILLPVVEVIGVSIEAKEDQTLLRLLIELAEYRSKFLEPVIEPIFEMCIKHFNNKIVKDCGRHLALEVMVSLAENEPNNVRNSAGKYVNNLIRMILQMMTDVDEDLGWPVSDDVDVDEFIDNNMIAESALNRLICGLGGKSVLSHISTLPAHVNWKQRYAVLMAISAIGEDSHEKMEEMLEEVMQGVIGFLNDSHSQDCCAALKAIGKMSTVFAPVFENKFHEQVIPGLLNLLDEIQNPKIQAHAGAALANFSKECPKNILTKYLDNIMQKLGSILNTDCNELLIQVVITIASVAKTIESEFTVHYDVFMPILMNIISNSAGKELRMLREKTIECVSLIGLAVGKEKFTADANAIMTLLLEEQTVGDLPDDDPQTSCLISSCGFMYKAMGKHFDQFLPLVMGPAMKTAAKKPELEDIEGDFDWTFKKFPNQMADKAAACDLLVCLAREFKEGFADYAAEVVKLMVPMLTYYLHDGVRTAAAKSLPYLLDCAKYKGPTYLEGMWQYMRPELLKAIDNESESDVLFELLHSLAKSIEILGPIFLSAENMTEMLRLISKYMEDHFRKSEKRALARNEEDYGDGVKLAENDNNDTHKLSKIADIIHSLFLTNGVSFLPHFDQVVQHFIKLLDPSRPWTDRQWGLCIFDDVIEYTGPMCAQYQHIFLQPVIECTKDMSPEVRQAAIYGCGVIAQFAGDQFAITCAQAMPRLIDVVQATRSRDLENVMLTEKAIAAITKILKYNSSALPNIDEIIMLWFSWLPVVLDHKEASHVYGYLCDLIQSNHVAVVGIANANLPRILQIIAEAFNTGVIEPRNEDGTRMLQIVQQLERNQELFKACYDKLTPEQGEALKYAHSIAIP